MTDTTFREEKKSIFTESRNNLDFSFSIGNSMENERTNFLQETDKNEFLKFNTSEMKNEINNNNSFSKEDFNNLMGQMPNFIKNYDELIKKLSETKEMKDELINLKNNDLKFKNGINKFATNYRGSKNNHQSRESPLKNLLTADLEQKVQKFSLQNLDEIDIEVRSLVSSHKTSARKMNQAIREFFSYSKDCLKAIKTIKMPTIKEIESYFIDLPISPEILKIKKVAIFDLDETLVHCEVKDIHKTEVALKVTLSNGQTVNIGINIRPFAIETLREISKDYIMIVYTASNQIYADAALDYIDPDKDLFHHRLYRQNCIRVKMESEFIYVKDLRILRNINLKNTVIIDNSILSFSFQINNGIPILPYHDNKSDDELKFLSRYLKHLLKYSDVREENIKNFNLENFCSEQLNSTKKSSKFYDTNSDFDYQVSSSDDSSFTSSGYKFMVD